MAANDNVGSSGASSLLGMFAPPAANDDDDVDNNNNDMLDQDRASCESPSLSSLEQAMRQDPLAQFPLHQQEQPFDNGSSNEPSESEDHVFYDALLHHDDEEDLEDVDEKQQPRQKRSENNDHEEDRRPTVMHSNFSKPSQQQHEPQLKWPPPSLSVSSAVPTTEETPLLRPTSSPTATTRQTTPLASYFQPIVPDSSSPSSKQPSATVLGKDTDDRHDNPQPPSSSFQSRLPHVLRHLCHELTQPGTWIGGTLFVLYHTLYALTMGSSLMRPNSQSQGLLGLLSKQAAGGVIFASPVFWIALPQVPAVYATCDLFAAPFLAEMVRRMDPILQQQASLDDTDTDMVFLSTLCFLASISMLLTGTMVVLASIFKLANLGSFLPYPVLAGFFAAVALLTWQLAFQIDAQGQHVGDVIMSGNLDLILTSIGHHAPSLGLAVLMKALGPKHPFYVSGLVVASVAMFYLVMAALGVSRAQAVEAGWFWSTSDLFYAPLKNKPHSLGFKDWVIPAPFGWLKSFFVYQQINWEAVQSCLDTSVALAFLYLTRTSLHAPALKKNVQNLERPEPPAVPALADAMKKESSTVRTTNVNSAIFGSESPARSGSAGAATSTNSPSFTKLARNRRKFSEKVDMEHGSITHFKDSHNNDGNHTQQTSPDAANMPRMVPAKPLHYTLKEIMAVYGYAQIVSAMLGFFFITPNISTMSTLYKLRAETLAPQILACLLLLGFYLFDFSVVGYIPKNSFSSLLVLASLENFHVFVVKSYHRTTEKLEWLVVPLIVILAFVVGLLNAVFLGLAISTFFFVASFFRSGVVKFLATGTTIRSTIERTPQAALWLDQNGGLIQVLVLQNYLFFGNSSSLVHYVCSMFEEPEEGIDESLLPPLPKILVLDLSLVSGMDTSAVDVFTEVLHTCGMHGRGCKLFLAGVSTRLRQTLHRGGFRLQDTAQPYADRPLRFFADLDTAVGKAEDLLLAKEESFEDRIQHIQHHTGFLRALQCLDNQHEVHCFEGLAGLEPFMQQIALEPGERLYEDMELERGLFFIEHGVIKVEQSAQDTIGRTGSLGRSGSTLSLSSMNNSLNALNARSLAAKRMLAMQQEDKSFRVARVGPGWILGAGESLTGTQNPGRYIAVSQSVLHFLSYRKVEELEQEHPQLMLKLQKLLSYLMAKRQRMTINQLATLHTIVSSPAHRGRPVSRSKHGSSSFAST